jgi:hypothetical protein
MASGCCSSAWRSDRFVWPKREPTVPVLTVRATALAARGHRHRLSCGGTRGAVRARRLRTQGSTRNALPLGHPRMAHARAAGECLADGHFARRTNILALKQALAERAAHRAQREAVVPASCASLAPNATCSRSGSTSFCASCSPPQRGAGQHQKDCSSTKPRPRVHTPAGEEEPVDEDTVDVPAHKRKSASWAQAAGSRAAARGDSPRTARSRARVPARRRGARRDRRRSQRTTGHHPAAGARDPPRAREVRLPLLRRRHQAGGAACADHPARGCSPKRRKRGWSQRSTTTACRCTASRR